MKKNLLKYKKTVFPSFLNIDIFTRISNAKT